MGLIELFLIAVGLSMDAFAVAVCKGLAMEKCTVKKAGIVGLYFGRPPPTPDTGRWGCSWR